MIGTVVNAVYFVSTIIYYGLFVSYKIGQFLVASINGALENIIILVNIAFDFLTILGEAFTIFFQDVFHCSQEVYRLASYLLEFVIGSIISVLSNVNNSINNLFVSVAAAYHFILNCFFTMGTIIGNTFVFLKRLVVLFGSGVWFSVTFIPLLLIYTGTLCVYYTGRLLMELKDTIVLGVTSVTNGMKEFYEFVTDVPVESIAGITIAICLIYIVTQFHVVLYSNMYRHCMKAARHVKSRYNRLRRQQRVQQTTRWSPRSRPQIAGDSRLQNQNEAEDERHCVICHEHVRCILLLPCKHMCMCNECSARLKFYNNTCPICRNKIESTMKIFI